MQSLSRQINLEETLYALERAVENHSRPGDEALLDRSILQKIQKALLTESRLIDEPARYGWLVAWAGIALLQEDVGAYNTKLQHLAERICQAQKHTTKHRGMVAVEREWLWFLEGDQWLEPPAGTEFHGYSGEYAHMQANLHTLLRPLEVGKLHNLCTVVGVLRLCTPHEQTALLYDDMSVVEMINEMPADSELQQRADDYHKAYHSGLLIDNPPVDAIPIGLAMGNNVALFLNRVNTRMSAHGGAPFVWLTVAATSPLAFGVGGTMPDGEVVRIGVRPEEMSRGQLMEATQHLQDTLAQLTGREGV